jgi:HEAT repeat protein
MAITGAPMQAPPPPPPQTRRADAAPLAKTARRKGEADAVPLVPLSKTPGSGRGFLLGAGAAVCTAALAGVLYFAFVHKRTTTDQPEDAPLSILEVLALSEDLKSNDKEKRAQAAVALGKAGKEARAALPALLEALGDEDEKIRDLVADALDQAGPPSKEDMPAVSTALRDDDPDVRAYAVSVLNEMGEDGWGEIEQVRELAKDPDPIVRDAATKTLARLEKEILEALRQRLKDSNPDVRKKAAEDMSELGGASPEAAKNAAGSLTDALADDNEAVREAVSKALSEFGSQVVPILASALAANNKYKRRTAIASLANMGADAIEAVPAIAGVVASDPDEGVANAAAEALANNFEDLAAPGLAAALASPTIIDNRRALVQNTLVRIGPRALPAVNYYVGRYGLASNVYFNSVVTRLRAIDLVPWVRTVPVDPFLRRSYLAYYGDYVGRFRGWLDARGQYLNLEKVRAGLKMDGNSFKYFLNRLDRDGDGRISRAEYERWAHDHASQLAKEDHARKALLESQKSLRSNVAANTKAAQEQAAAVVRQTKGTVAKNTNQRAAAEAQLRSMRKKALPQQAKAQQDLINKQRALARVQRQTPAAKHAPAPTKRVQPVRPVVNRPVPQKPPTRKPVVHHPVAAHHSPPPPPPRGGGRRR